LKTKNIVLPNSFVLPNHPVRLRLPPLLQKEGNRECANIKNSPPAKGVSGMMNVE